MYVYICIYINIYVYKQRYKPLRAMKPNISSPVGPENF